jgi:ABC-2 type transport system permease protein
LPVPRLTLALASLTVWILVALPGMVLALISASAWYDLGLRISPLLLPAALLTVLVATSVGFAFAHALPHPTLIALITNILVFGILMYSPINYPAERLPAWLQAVHQFLPIQHSAIVMRGALIEGMGEAQGRSYLILGVWTVVAWAITLWVLNRRR